MQALPNVLMKYMPCVKGTLPMGQYYFNFTAFDEVEIAGWRVSLSGPGPNGPLIVSFLVDKDDPTVVEFLKAHTVEYMAGVLYGATLLNYPYLDVVARCSY